MFNVLHNNGFHSLPQNRDRPNPDFKLLFPERNVYIEAVIAGKGTGTNEVETIGDRLSRVPSGTLITGGGHIDDGNHPKVRRILNALDEKQRRYFEKHRNAISQNDCYVIAVNGGQIDGYVMEEGLILEAVMGINPAIHLPLRTDGSLGPGYHTTRQHVQNALGTNLIDIATFLRDEFREISGVMYFGSDTVNAVLQQSNPEQIILVHNPNVIPAKALPLDTFKMFTQITFTPTEWIRHLPKT